MDTARFNVIRSEIDEAADHALAPQHRCHRVLVEAVLNGNGVAVIGEEWRETAHRRVRVLALDAEERAPVSAAQRVGRDGGRGGGKAVDRALDRKPGRRDRVDVVVHDVDERHVVAGACEEGADGPADRTGSPDEQRCRHDQGPSRSARVSSTAVCQSAIISSSGFS